MIHELEGKRVLVAGMAKSGLAAVELLLKKGAQPFAMDLRTAGELGPVGARLAELGVPLLPQTIESLSNIDVLVLSPGVPVDAPEVEAARSKGIPVIGEVELASYFLEGPTIGITGSNGKTTTTALIGHILKNSFLPLQIGGNIGTPPTAMVESSRREQWNVLELSSFQLETIEHFSAQIGVCLNLTPDHLDRHHTLEAYAAAKRRLFETQHEGAWAVLNADDPICVSYASHTKATPFWFSQKRSLNPGICVEYGNIILNGEPLMSTADIPLPGGHNVENSLAASAAAHLAGAKPEQIAAAIRTFPGVEHRLEFVRERNGVRYYNDSKATNVDATQKALDAFPGGLWIILGGKDKGSDYTVLADSLRTKARGVLLIGKAAPIIASQLQGYIDFENAGTLDVAIRTAASKATAGEIVLLAPACASFDQFENFEHRGRVFKQIVQSL